VVRRAEERHPGHGRRHRRGSRHTDHCGGRADHTAGDVDHAWFEFDLGFELELELRFECDLADSRADAGRSADDTGDAAACSAHHDAADFASVDDHADHERR
jgi:hypothetical protein